MTTIAQNIPSVTGTWTPVDSSGAGLTFTSVSAGYTRLGNMVFAYGVLTYPSTADGSNAVIGGLPFSVANASYARQATINFQATGGALGELALIPAQNATTMAVFAMPAGTAITNAQMSLGILRFMAIYPIT